MAETIISYSTPIVIYKSIKVASNDIALSGKGKVSFIAPYNKVDIIMYPTNCSLSYYEVRITKEDENFDIGVGQLAYYATNIPNQNDYSYSISVNSTNFSKGDGVYRLGLYAKSSIDESWDVTYLFFTVSGSKFVPSDADGFTVLTTQAAPNN